MAYEPITEDDFHKYYEENSRRIYSGMSWADAMMEALLVNINKRLEEFDKRINKLENRE